MRTRSFGALLQVIVVFTAMRLFYWKPAQPSPGNVLAWDAFGYYLDLPGVFIYRDIAKLDWLPGVPGNTNRPATCTRYRHCPAGTGR